MISTVTRNQAAIRLRRRLASWSRSLSPELRDHFPTPDDAPAILDQWIARARCPEPGNPVAWAITAALDDLTIRFRDLSGIDPAPARVPQWIADPDRAPEPAESAVEAPVWSDAVSLALPSAAEEWGLDGPDQSPYHTLWLDLVDRLDDPQTTERWQLVEFEWVHLPRHLDEHQLERWRMRQSLSLEVVALIEGLTPFGVAQRETDLIVTLVEPLWQRLHPDSPFPYRIRPWHPRPAFTAGADFGAHDTKIKLVAS